MLYALFFNSDVYHYVEPSDNNDYEKTYCNTPLAINRGQEVSDKANSGYPGPKIRKSPPPKKRLCKYCRQIRSNSRKQEKISEHN